MTIIETWYRRKQLFALVDWLDRYCYLILAAIFLIVHAGRMLL